MSAGESLGPQFEFIKAEPRAMSPNHTVIAKVGDEIAGHLEWSHKTGRIVDVLVDEPYQRQGIATSLWKQAHEAARSTHGVKPPKHSSDRTDEGDAWARSISKRLPRREERSQW